MRQSNNRPSMQQQTAMHQVDEAARATTLLPTG